MILAVLPSRSYGTLYLIEREKNRTAVKGETNEFCPLMAVFID